MSFEVCHLNDHLILYLICYSIHYRTATERRYTWRIACEKDDDIVGLLDSLGVFTIRSVIDFLASIMLAFWLIVES